MKSRLARIMFCAAAALPVMAQGPAWDSSGNSLLNGTYYFRQVVYGNNASAFYGGISFDGNGNWTISGAQTISTNVNNVQTFSAKGTYTLSSAGFGYLISPADSTQRVYIMVANGIAMGSATENSTQYVDLFVAAPLSNPQPTVSSLQGTYQAAYFRPDFVNGASYDVDALIQMSSNGAGQINASMNGYVGGGGSQAYTQVSNGLKYIYSNGAANITFPNVNNAAFINNENEYLYMSPDGNFVFGGSPTDFDMFLGVKTNNSNPANFSGLFYQAGLDDDNSSTGQGALDGWYGSMQPVGGLIYGHQRQAYGGSVGRGFTYGDSYGNFQNGGYTDTDTSLQYVFSQNGAIRIGLGIGPYMGINVAMQAPTLSGGGVYLNPQGITNSASSSTFTAGFSNGELITLYGSNLAPNTFIANSLPWPKTTTNGVQVMINGVNAPIYYASPTQVSVVVPFENTFPVAQIQVINGSQSSNIVTTPVFQTTPGVYTIASQFGGVGPGGLGYAAAEHADYSVVTSSNPAQPGETLMLYLTGLGAVYPPNPDGAAGPTNPFSLVTSTITVYVNGTASPAQAYVGLAPALAGLYQINFQVPTGLQSGTYLLGISGPDSYSDEAILQVGGSTSGAGVKPSPMMRRGVHGSSRIERRPPVMANPRTPTM